MQTLAVIAALVIGLLFTAPPADAAWQAGSDQASATSVVVAADVCECCANHCHHVPCPNPAHAHGQTSCCSGHTFIGAPAHPHLGSLNCEPQVAAKSETLSGRTPVPPVRPPLA